jgi:hypothetical protein
VHTIAPLVARSTGTTFDAAIDTVHIASVIEPGVVTTVIKPVGLTIKPVVAAIKPVFATVQTVIASIEPVINSIILTRIGLSANVSTRVNVCSRIGSRCIGLSVRVDVGACLHPSARVRVRLSTQIYFLGPSPAGRGECQHSHG